MEGFNDSQVFNGSYGEVWFNDNYLAEATSVKAEVTVKYDPVTMPRKLIAGQKMTAQEGKGELKMHKVSSYVMKMMSDYLKAGKTPSVTIISKIDDPDAIGSERVALYGCKLDKAILVDWEREKLGEESYSFSFNDWELMDTTK